MLSRLRVCLIYFQSFCRLRRVPFQLLSRSCCTSGGKMASYLLLAFHSHSGERKIKTNQRNIHVGVEPRKDTQTFYELSKFGRKRIFLGRLRQIGRVVSCQLSTNFFAVQLIVEKLYFRPAINRKQTVLFLAINCHRCTKYTRLGCSIAK